MDSQINGELEMHINSLRRLHMVGFLGYDELALNTVKGKRSLKVTVCRTIRHKIHTASRASPVHSFTFLLGNMGFVQTGKNSFTNADCL